MGFFFQGRCPVARVLFFLTVIVIGMPSCTTYHKVAVWYKYRKDFHLPKEQNKGQYIEQSQNEQQAAAIRPATHTTDAALEVTDTPVPAAQPKPSFFARIAKRRHATPSNSSTPEGDISASLATGLNPARKPVWVTAEPQQTAPAALDTRPIHWTAIVGFALSILAIPAFFIFLSYLFGIFVLTLLGGFVFSIVSLFLTGPEKRHRGRGFGVAGLVISIFDVFLLILLLILILIALASWS